MENLIGLVAVILSMGIPIYVIKRRYDYKERHLKAGDEDREEAKRIESLENQRKLLQERVENLESIVTNVDYELNLRIANLTSMKALPPVSTQESKTSAEIRVAETPPAEMATDRTLTAGVQGAELAQKAAALRAAAGPELRLGAVLGQRYRIQRLLGRGGMGAVYLADDEVLGESVALKVISSAYAPNHAELSARFRREASAARKVSHANVIRIHDLGETADGLLYISMEYFAGKTLADLLASRGALGGRDVTDILGQICDGIDAAHDAGVVHRDLKPQNVLIGERRAVKVIDFGLAKTSTMASMTATGIMLGTPHYMSPEQVRGTDVDARSDIYSLGAVAYHMVTGAPPFTGDNPITIGFAHCSQPPRPARELAPKLSLKLEQVIMQALAKAPRDRPSSAREFRDALDADDADAAGGKGA